MKTVRVSLYWLTPAEGGGARIPSWRVSTVIRFEGDEVSSENTWSILATYVTALEHRKCEADMRFLAETAPHEQLKPGVKFDLMAGHTVIANGEVLFEINAVETPGG